MLFTIRYKRIQNYLKEKDRESKIKEKLKKNRINK